MNKQKDLQVVYTRKANVLNESLDDETVLYDLSTNLYVVMNETATFVWNRCDGTTSVAEIIDLFEPKYGVEGAHDFV